MDMGTASQPQPDVEAQLEGIRQILRTVHRTFDASEPAPVNLEELIGKLLSNGISLHDIAFLIEEAGPV